MRISPFSPAIACSINKNSQQHLLLHLICFTYMTSNAFVSFSVACLSTLLLFSCAQPSPKKKDAAPVVVIRYDEFKDSVLHTDTALQTNTSNVFDGNEFTPGSDSVEQLLVNIDTLLHRQVNLIDYLDTVKNRVKKTPGYSAEEKEALRENMRMLDSFLTTHSSPDTLLCRDKECLLYLEIDKARQKLYLYFMGQLKDSFAVSTGKGKYETPNLDMRPQGPVVTRYSSRKFPGGNYMQLGNMPYAIFLKNGYAIHGTTTGNFTKLGTRASHGCVRVHPDNAKIINSLVKTVGLSQTWVRIEDSISRGLLPAAVLPGQ